MTQNRSCHDLAITQSAEYLKSISQTSREDAAIHHLFKDVRRSCEGMWSLICRDNNFHHPAKSLPSQSREDEGQEAQRRQLLFPP